ncbi:MAG: hypothetical protein EAZ55_09540 [Cytophagales bacterium]|nr:MAG: hypothetical protein EAZ55_09540 [Cytophagales bacterium]
METNKIIMLLQSFDAFEKETQSTDLEAFAYWTLRKKNEKQGEETQLNRDLGYALNRVNRYSKLFAKQYLEGLPIHSLDEFSFLTSITFLINPSKSEVYDNTLTELATGQQMMRRLIQMGLVEETEDEKDKRIKRVQLTTEGERVQNLAFQQIGEECNFKFKVLDVKDKISLLEILNQLLKSFE